MITADFAMRVFLLSVTFADLTAWEQRLFLAMVGNEMESL